MEDSNTLAYLSYVPMFQGAHTSHLYPVIMSLGSGARAGREHPCIIINLDEIAVIPGSPFEGGQDSRAGSISKAVPHLRGELLAGGRMRQFRCSGLRGGRVHEGSGPRS